ncbi:hypothetical protein BJ742DRAFT_858717 [Cladochytrium replicatum]|nr:hypothetical protein BJ742DRAFT_858717 [Cladochytrium replicatum]
MQSAEQSPSALQPQPAALTLQNLQHIQIPPRRETRNLPLNAQTTSSPVGSVSGASDRQTAIQLPRPMSGYSSPQSIRNPMAGVDLATPAPYAGSQNNVRFRNQQVNLASPTFSVATPPRSPSVSSLASSDILPVFRRQSNRHSGISSIYIPAPPSDVLSEPNSSIYMPSPVEEFPQFTFPSEQEEDSGGSDGETTPTATQPAKDDTLRRPQTQSTPPAPTGPQPVSILKKKLSTEALAKMNAALGSSDPSKGILSGSETSQSAGSANDGSDSRKVRSDLAVDVNAKSSENVKRPESPTAKPDSNPEPRSFSLLYRLDDNPEKDSERPSRTATPPAGLAQKSGRDPKVPTPAPLKDVMAEQIGARDYSTNTSPPASPTDPRMRQLGDYNQKSRQQQETSSAYKAVASPSLRRATSPAPGSPAVLLKAFPKPPPSELSGAIPQAPTFTGWLFKLGTKGRWQYRFFKCDGTSLTCFSPKTATARFLTTSHSRANDGIDVLTELQEKWSIPISDVAQIALLRKVPRRPSQLNVGGPEASMYPAHNGNAPTGTIGRAMAKLRTMVQHDDGDIGSPYPPPMTDGVTVVANVRTLERDGSRNGSMNRSQNSSSSITAANPFDGEIDIVSKCFAIRTYEGHNYILRAKTDDDTARWVWLLVRLWRDYNASSTPTSSQQSPMSPTPMIQYQQLMQQQQQQQPQALSQRQLQQQISSAANTSQSPEQQPGEKVSLPGDDDLLNQWGLPSLRGGEKATGSSSNQSAPPALPAKDESVASGVLMLSPANSPKLGFRPSAAVKSKDGRAIPVGKRESSLRIMRTIPNNTLAAPGYQSPAMSSAQLAVYSGSVTRGGTTVSPALPTAQLGTPPSTVVYSPQMTYEIVEEEDDEGEVDDVGPQRWRLTDRGQLPPQVPPKDQEDDDDDEEGGADWMSDQTVTDIMQRSSIVSSSRVKSPRNATRLTVSNEHGNATLAPGVTRSYMEGSSEVVVIDDGPDVEEEAEVVKLVAVVDAPETSLRAWRKSMLSLQTSERSSDVGGPNRSESMKVEHASMMEEQPNKQPAEIMEVLDTLATSQEWMDQIPETNEPPQQLRQEVQQPQSQMASPTGQPVVPRQVSFAAANITVPKRGTSMVLLNMKLAAQNAAAAGEQPPLPEKPLPPIQQSLYHAPIDTTPVVHWTPSTAGYVPPDTGRPPPSSSAMARATTRVMRWRQTLVELLADDPEVHVDVTPTSPTGYTDASGNPHNSITTITTISHTHYGTEASDSPNVAAQFLQQTLNRDSTVKRMLPPPPVRPPPPPKGTGSWQSGALSLQQQLQLQQQQQQMLMSQQQSQQQQQDPVASSRPFSWYMDMVKAQSMPVARTG